jgi:nucleoside-diphosphate-sugar epimerase
MILGANGFIGSALTNAILRTRDWEVYAMDLANNKLGDLPTTNRFHFVEGDITINKEWVEYHVKKCDVVVPLVAIANPAQYVTHPLRVFELDFEANLPIVRQCVKYNKRLIFPSTSEVYGMSPDAVLDEETSSLVYGPINKQRWIYATSKQLLDRVIYAYGVRDNLDYTLFRPFNFIGPNLDNVEEPKEGSSRVFTQFLSNVLYRRPIKLVDGGQQKRSFTFIDDAIECLLTIIQNQNGCASRKIFNIGNPGNCVSMRELAQKTIAIAQEFPILKDLAKATEIVEVSSGEYYGKGYQDIQVRVPAIEAARRELGGRRRRISTRPSARPSTTTSNRKTSARSPRLRPWRTTAEAGAPSETTHIHRDWGHGHRGGAGAAHGRAWMAGVGGSRGGLVRDRPGPADAGPGRRTLRRDPT